jgi:nicotinamidase-related amidase
MRGGAGAVRRPRAAFTSQRGDQVILKPMHSAFMGTPLDLMLHHMGVKAVILAGFAVDMCIQC